MRNKKKYFAYGSNTNLRQMAQRCPKAVKVGPATLRNYNLGFNGKSNGWGVANIRRWNGRQVDGLLWEITKDCEDALDRYEGYPFLYTKRTVTVYDEDGKAYKAMVYVMTADYNCPAIPDPYYYKGIARGFMQNGISLDTLVTALRETVLTEKEL